MKYATVTSAGVLTGFLDDSINTIPAAAVELTDAQHSEWVTQQSRLIWQNGALVAAPAPAVSAAQKIAANVAAAVAAGCQIVSTSTPAISGTYAIDPASTSQINAVATYIAINNRFPAGQSALSWPDVAGALHIFSTTAEFQAFASAIADWMTKISLYANGVATALPTGGETIP